MASFLTVAMCAGLMVCNAASASSNAGLAASSFSSATALSSYWSKNSMFSVSYWFPPSTLSNCNCNVGSKGGAVVRALASHQCGPVSNPGVDAICGLSYCGFSPFLREVFLRVLRFSPLLKNQHLQSPSRVFGLSTEILSRTS